MRLDGLQQATSIDRMTGDASVEVTSVSHDSRSVAPGALFCCVRGDHVDGHDFAPEAVDAGAAALLCERDLPLAVPQAIVSDTRLAMGPVAAAVLGDPSRRLTVVGITGTNGKTTTAHLLQAVLETAGRSTGVIGTLTGTRTTPEAPELQAALADAVARGSQAVAMEVSSHALALHRVDGTWFEVGVFTNLSREHLDFHKTMEDYFAAKASLFVPHRCGSAVVNVDDSAGRRLIDQTTVPWQPYGLSLVEDVYFDVTSGSCRWEGLDLRVPLGGRFNLSNALAAAVTARRLGIAAEAIVAGLAAAPPVPGRFEMVDAGQPFAIVVDYAHTPDGLEQVLLAAREVTRGHALHVVFGCGGDRDATKRTPMGEIADRLADDVIITSDNPRSEDPALINESILAGMTHAKERRTAGTLVVEPDRRAAIEVAIAHARAGDVVVIAGKGHETTQVVGDDVIEHDDRAVARELISGSARW